MEGDEITFILYIGGEIKKEVNKNRKGNENPK